MYKNTYFGNALNRHPYSLKKLSLLSLSILSLPLALHAVTFNDWIASFDAPEVPEEARGLADDPDSDGVPSGIEYIIAGMDPTVADAQLLPKPLVEDGEIVYSIAKRTDLTEPELQTVIEVFNTDSDEWEVVTENVVDTSESIRYSGLAEADSILARLKVITSAPASASNPIALAYPVEYDNGEYGWTDSIKWVNIYNVTDYGAVADGDAAYVRTEPLVFEDASTDPLRPDYIIPAGIPISWGTDNHDAFTNAIAAAHDAGGGVVFVPAGTYYIADHLYLREGVVIMGETPAEGEAVAREESFNPPSKLIFPRYVTAYDPETNPNGNPMGGGGPHVGFKRIFTEDPLTASNLGLVWLDINRAAIIIDTPSRLPIDSGGNWSGKPGTIRMDLQGKNRIIYGVRSNNAAVAEGADGANSGVPYSGQESWQRWTYRFNANIRIGGGGNTIIANCRLNDLSQKNDHRWGSSGEVGSATFYDDSFEQIGYMARADSGSTQYPLNNIGQATFRHSNQYGISLNGLFYFSSAGQNGFEDPDGNPSGHFGTPVSAPHLFHPGNVIRDSYVYSTLGAKVEVSGQGLRFLTNHLDDADFKQAFLRSDGRSQPTGSAFMSRAMLYGGYDVLLDGNIIKTTKHRLGNVISGSDGAYFSNDGEGMMIDNTTTRVDGLTITNNTMYASIFAYRTREIRDVLIANNVFPDESFGAILLISNDAQLTNYGAKNVVIEDNVITGDNNIRIAASEVMNRNPEVNNLTPSSDIYIRNNDAPKSTRSISYSPSLEDIIVVEDNTNFTVSSGGTDW